LCKAEVVVRRNVENTSAGASEFVGLVVVVTLPVEDHDRSASDAGDRLVEAVVDTSLETASVERVEVRVERRVTLQTRQWSVDLEE
jgi:hypothetical protein